MSCYLILKLRLQQERHVVHARQRARDIAHLLGFDRQEQVRLATATSELARNAFRYAREGVVEFLLCDDRPHSFVIEVRDSGPGIENLDTILSGQYQSKTGLGKGLTGTRRLMDAFHIETKPHGTSVRVSKVLPAVTEISSSHVNAIARKLAEANVDPFEEVERQNQDLLRTLAELREKQEMLAQVNSELEDTNRGVVALYAELERNASDLRRISDQKTSFLSNLSHEFRTPLNAILALCGILNSRSDGDLTDEQAKQVGYIRRSAADLSELVNDLLDVAKVEAGKIEIKPVMFTVSDLFGALRGMLRTLLTGNAVQLNFASADDLPILFTDESKVSQILRNLISNALKFTERGHVQVSAELQRDHILFRVADTGIGVAPQDQDRIFDEFVQVSGPIQSRVKGTGLGLPLSRKLAQLLGGTLQVESVVGAGSTFTVVLPIHFVALTELTPSPAPQGNDLPQVLIVEDNAETRFIHQSALSTTRYNLFFARNVAEARSFVVESSPRAIILDRMLEGEDALPFLTELRTNGYAGGVIVVSVVDEPEAALNAGADAFLSKPIGPGLLAGKVTELLGGHRGKPLLLVDDDEVNRYVLREALALLSLSVLEARSGRDALQIAADCELGAIFLDMSMPGLTGLETLRELRRMPSTAAIPVIIHTSKTLSAEELTMVEDLGAFIFSKEALHKPDASEALRATLGKAGAL